MDTKTFQPSDILAQLLGQKTTTDTSSSANVAPLQQVFDRNMAPMSQELYNNLITSIFQKAGQNVPSITAALSNATGTRSSSNSPLALALNQQNNEAATAAAAAILGQNNTQQQIASNAANGIATNTRGQTSTQKTGSGTDPLLTMLGGWALNKADKSGLIDKFTGGVSDMFGGTNFGGGGADVSSIPMGYDYGGAAATPFGGGGTDFTSFGGGGGGGSGFDFGGFGDSVMSGASDIYDTVTSGASGIWDSVSSFFGFADGGMPNTMMTPMTGMRTRYADGGMTQVQDAAGRGVMGSRQNVIDGAEAAAVTGNDPNVILRQILAAAVSGQPAPVQPQPQAQAPDLMGFIQYLMNSGSGIKRNQFADGGNRMMTPLVGTPNGYADGGVVRNRNNMGGPLTRYGVNSVNYGDSGATGFGGGAGASNAGLQDLVSRAIEEYQMGKGGGNAGTPREQGPSTIGGTLNKELGDPQGKEMGPKVGAAIAGTMNPVLGMLVSVMNGGSPTDGGWGSVAKTAYKQYKQRDTAEGAINASPDPLGSFIAALSQASGPDNIGFDPRGVNPATIQAAVNSLGAFGVPGTQTALDTSMGPQMPGTVVPGIDLNTGLPADQTVGGNGGRDPTDPNNGNYGLGATDPSGFGNMGGDVNASTGGTNSEADGGIASNFRIVGKGSGTSDSIRMQSKEPGGLDARYSNGEGVIPEDVISAMGGWKFFQQMIDQFHTPVNR